MYEHLLKNNHLFKQFFTWFFMFASDRDSCRFTCLECCIACLSIMSFKKEKQERKKIKDYQQNVFQALLFSRNFNPSFSNKLSTSSTEFLKHTVGSFHLSSCPKYSRQRDVRIMAAKIKRIHPKYLLLF